MDTFGIIKKEGYRREDLSEENQKILKGIDFMIETLDFENVCDYAGIDEDSLIDKIEKEIAEKVYNAIVELLLIQQAELQISLAEDEE